MFAAYHIWIKCFHAKWYIVIRHDLSVTSYLNPKESDTYIQIATSFLLKVEGNWKVPVYWMENNTSSLQFITVSLYHLLFAAGISSNTPGMNLKWFSHIYPRSSLKITRVDTLIYIKVLNILFSVQKMKSVCNPNSEIWYPSWNAWLLIYIID